MTHIESELLLLVVGAQDASAKPATNDGVCTDPGAPCDQGQGRRDEFGAGLSTNTRLWLRANGWR